MRILFVTSRNVINTCGELRLIKNRAICLHDTYGVSTDFIVYRSNKCNSKPQEEIGAESTLTKCLYNVKNPFSISRNFKFLTKLVLDSLSKNVHKAVVLSGNIVLPLAKKIKKAYPNVKIIVDVHGALEELVEFNDGGFVKRNLRKLLFRPFKKTEKKYMPYADGIFAVSNALKHYLISEYFLIDKKFFIVPCAQNRKEINASEKVANRQKYREKYGVLDDEKLFIYSGGLSPWQCVEESVNLFKAIKTKEPKAKLLLLTGAVEKIRKYEGNGILVDSIPFNLVDEVICAGDYAFMLRGDYITNNVAYPNKFIEYVSSGMKIIATPYVDDIAKQIESSGVGCILDKNPEEELIKYLQKDCEYLSDIENRQKLLDDLCFENRLKPFAEYLKGEDR